MRPIAPRIQGADEFVVAEEQLQYMPVVACLVQFDDELSRVCRWTFTPEERAKIAAGEDLYFGTPARARLTPHWLCVGFPP